MVFIFSPNLNFSVFSYLFLFVLLLIRNFIIPCSFACFVLIDG